MSQGLKLGIGIAGGMFLFWLALLAFFAITGAVVSAVKE